MTVADVVAGPTNETVTVSFCCGWASDTEAVHVAADAGDADATTGSATPSAMTKPRRARTYLTVAIEGDRG